MDLGIAGKWALVCAASKGLGKGCAQALVREGANVVITARGAEALEATAQELQGLNPAAQVRAVPGDITTAEGRSAALAACPQVDILVNNAGGPPPGDFRDWDRAAWIAALDANMLTPIELIKATVDKMAERGFGRVVNITSAAVKAPIDILGLSNGARSGLTGFVAGLARQHRLASRNVTINNLLPGPFDTDRLRTTIRGAAAKTGQSIEAIAQARAKALPAQRFGNVEEFGAVCAFLCSTQAGYLTAQNILLDGGGYPGTF
jgi:3-oxoacyl-[acyl-carrier protein] reductase